MPCRCFERRAQIKAAHAALRAGRIEEARAALIAAGVSAVDDFVRMALAALPADRNPRRR